MSFTVLSPRFKNWVIHLLFTLIVLISLSLVEITNDEKSYEPSNLGKALGLAFSIFILIVNLGVIVMHFLPIGTLLIGSKVEGVIPFVLTGFWTGLVWVNTGEDGLAIDKYDEIYLGNLYYFTWAGFITSAIIFASVCEEIFNVDIISEMRDRSSSFMYWSLLMATSIVVMGVSSDFYNRRCDTEGKDVGYCKRTALAVATGVVGALFSLLVVVLKISIGAAPFLLETALCSLLLFLYLVEVMFVTDDGAPGAPLGNLYYFSWASLVLTFLVGKACLDDFRAAQAAMSEVQPSPVVGPAIVSVPSEDSDDTPALKNVSPPVNPEDDI